MNSLKQKTKHFCLKEFDSKELPFSVEVELNISEDNIMNIRYSILGDMSLIELPDLEKEKKRVIGLWESTCFEMFLKEPNTTNYFELNFSPEGHWNCFYFDKPGDFIKPYPLKEHPITTVEVDLKMQGYYKINVQFNLKSILKNFKNKSQVDIGLTSIVLYNNLTTYWAQEHYGETPNFHDFKTFSPWDLQKKITH